MNNHDHAPKQQSNKTANHNSHEGQLSGGSSDLTSFYGMRHASQKPGETTLTPRSVLQLQRTIGNKAVLQLLDKQLHRTASSDSNSYVHRYATREATHEETRDWVGKFQRSSGNGGIMQISEQVLVARDDIIEASEEKLAAQQSVVQLVKGDTFTPGYSRIKLQLRASRASSLRGGVDVESLKSMNAMEAEPRKAKHLEILNYTLEQNGLQTEDDPVKYSAAQEANKNTEREVKMVQTGATDMFLTIRDCHMTARLIMGDLGVGKAGGRREKISATSPTGENQKLLPTDADRENFATVGQKGAVKLLKYAFSSFGDVLTENGYSESHAELIKRVRNIASKWNYTEAMAIYGDIQKDTVIGSLFNRTYSINEYAKVAVGQALVQVNDENERLASVAGTLGKDLWNFHWAGVLMTDGDDYVTLQAVADQMASTLTVNWWFKMYGTGKQSFHSEEKEDTHVGTRPLTMSVVAE